VHSHDELTPPPVRCPIPPLDPVRRRIRDLVARGTAAEDPQERLRLFEEAHRLDLNDPWAMSHHGAALACVRRATLQGIAYCEEAVRRNGPAPELLLNLADAYLAALNKREAVRALRRALAVAPGDPRAARMIATLGLRRRPVVPFLPRSSLVNKYLGMLRHRLLSWGERAEDPSEPIPAELGQSAAQAPAPAHDAPALLPARRRGDA